MRENKSTPKPVKASGKKRGNKQNGVDQEARFADAKTVAPAKPEKRKKEYVGVTIPWPIPVLNIQRGDSLTFDPNGQAPLGKLIGIEDKEGFTTFARVCLNDERGVFLLYQDYGKEEDHCWLSELSHKAFGPVVKIKRASQVNAEKIDELRARIEKLRDNDTDAICDSTRLFELERELYALENPAEEEVFDWPEIIGEGGASDEA